MQRENLVAAVRKAAEGLGYTFYAESLLPRGGRISTLPAACLAPVKLTGAKGRRDCNATYGLTVTLMNQATEPAGEVWDVMECDALELVRLIGEEEGVIVVDGVRCTPCRLPVTRYGELALSVEMEVHMFYRR